MLFGYVLSMLMAYVDESGDTGDPSKGGSTGCFALGCVLVDTSRWSQTFDHLLDFRRNLRSTFQIPMRQEIKANYLIRNSGGLRDLNLSPSQRQLIYAYHLNQVAQTESRAFGVVVDKEAFGPGADYFAIAWETLIQRLERTAKHEQSEIFLTHDEGENAAVRKLARKSRRHLTSGSAFGPGSLTNRFDRLIDDPAPRVSHESYFLQLADLVAYAAWRTYTPPGAGAAKVVPQTMWGALGSGVHAKVNGLSRVGEPGVVIRKR